MADDFDEVRAIALALPETNERLSHGMPTFFVRDKKVFVSCVDDHHGDGRFGIWVSAAPGVQGELVRPGARAVLRPALCRPSRMGRGPARYRRRLG
ncbi:MAG: MmcQ/YjbR family DNA-binding protein [Acidimicrobiales bacterium]